MNEPPNTCQRCGAEHHYLHPVAECSVTIPDYRRTIQLCDRCRKALISVIETHTAPCGSVFKRKSVQPEPMGAVLCAEIERLQDVIDHYDQTIAANRASDAVKTGALVRELDEARARQDNAALCAEIERLTAENKSLRDELADFEMVPAFKLHQSQRARIAELERTIAANAESYADSSGRLIRQREAALKEVARLEKLVGWRTIETDSSQESRSGGGRIDV